MPFYPNECFVCRATFPLKRCNHCNMISYCGEDHQEKDWEVHKPVCEIISALLKERGLSHLYENLKGVDQNRWIKEREKQRLEVESKMNRLPLMREIEMFRFPKVCFVCYEARENLLDNCPNCPLASFCKDHPSSSIHDKNCLAIKESHDIESSFDSNDELISLTIQKVVGYTPTEKSAKPPTSMKAYLDQNLKPEYKLSENVKYFISEYLSIPLTIYNAFRKLNQPLKSEMVVHLEGIDNSHAFPNSWESLLHLLPDINSLSILLTEHNKNFKMNVKICEKCVSKKKELVIEGFSIPYAEYVNEKFSKKVDLFAVFHIQFPGEEEDTKLKMMWQMLMTKYCQLSFSPLVLVTYTKQNVRLITKSMRSTVCNSLIYYSGLNDFAPLYPTREWKKWSCCQSYKYFVVAGTSKDSPELGNRGIAAGSVEPKRRVWRKFFYASFCHVCRSANASVACRRCKMIFYCGENHQKMHWPKHKNICKVILGMLSESGAPNLFDKVKTEDGKLWLKVKIDLIKKAESKIGGKLSDEEREMFFFPKTCFVCHESDLSVLKNCECGISFCKMHKNNSKQKELCKEFLLSRRLMMVGDPLVMAASLKIMPRRNYSLPSSMKSFIDTYLKSKEKFRRFDFPNLHNILLSDSLTRVLTFLYSVDTLLDPCYTENDSLVVHVIGSTSREISEANYWKLVLYWLQHLKNLTVVFIGPEIEAPSFPSYLEAELDFSAISSLRKQNLKVETHPLRYEAYYQSKLFVQPDIVVGFNLNIHECELGISECTWKETALILAGMEVPFIMTAGSKARAKKDDRRFATLLGNTLNYISSKENPFASLIPKRDFETEGLRYSNKHILVYTTYYLEIKLEKSKRTTLAELEQELKDTNLKMCQMLSKGFEVSGNESLETKTEQAEKIKHEMEKNEKKKIEKSVRSEHSFEIEPGTENNEKKSLEVQNPEFEAEIENKESLNTEIEPGTENNEKKSLEVQNPECEAEIENKESLNTEIKPGTENNEKKSLEVQNPECEAEIENKESLNTEIEPGTENNEKKSLEVQNPESEAEIENKESLNTKIEPGTENNEKKSLEVQNPECEAEIESKESLNTEVEPGTENNEKKSLEVQNPECEAEIESKESWNTEIEPGTENNEKKSLEVQNPECEAEIENKEPLNTEIEPGTENNEKKSLEVQNPECEAEIENNESLNTKIEPGTENNEKKSLEVQNPECEAEIENKESLNTEVEPGTENNEKKSLEVQNPECEAEIESKESWNTEIKPEPQNNEFLKENLLLKEENKLLKENLLLKKENKQLKDENLKLMQENKKLREENESIKDFRKEIEESIRSTMNDNS